MFPRPWDLRGPPHERSEREDATSKKVISSSRYWILVLTFEIDNETLDIVCDLTGNRLYGDPAYCMCNAGNDLRQDEHAHLDLKKATIENLLIIQWIRRGLAIKCAIIIHQHGGKNSNKLHPLKCLELISHSAKYTQDERYAVYSELYTTNIYG